MRKGLRCHRPEPEQKKPTGISRKKKDLIMHAFIKVDFSIGFRTRNWAGPGSYEHLSITVKEIDVTRASK
jgi:hypothetical protein